MFRTAERLRIAQGTFAAYAVNSGGEFCPAKIFRNGQVAQVVERSPEKAGVGGSTPSLATMFSMSCMVSVPRIGDSWCQFGLAALAAAILSNAIALV